jgi:hypothetical protein
VRAVARELCAEVNQHYASKGACIEVHAGANVFTFDHGGGTGNPKSYNLVSLAIADPGVRSSIRIWATRDSPGRCRQAQGQFRMLRVPAQ